MGNYSTKLLGLAVLSVLTACGGEQAATTASGDQPAGAAAETSMEKPAQVAQVDTARIENAAQQPEQWMTYSGGYEEQRHSGLTTINRDTLSDLGVGWTYEMRKTRGVEATPVVVDGVMYVSGSWSVVYALDATTGEELWVYDPEVSGQDAAKGCCDVVNRGLAVYQGKVFVGVFDGRLEALDAATGELLWSTVTVDQSKPYTITGAPRAFNDKVIIGNGGAELGVRGYVTAYDTNTGELAWRFYATPNPEKKPDNAASDAIFAELANDTWGDTGAWTTDGGGGTAWDSIVYDPVNNQVVIGFGNGSPWNDNLRDPESNGDNLFLSSIVAVDADTGAYRWHFQTTPRDKWDYTATQGIVIADLPLGENGADRRVVMQAPKNGFFYVLDAATGQFISGTPYELQTWATGLTEEGRPIENPDARSLAPGYIALPGPMGGHNWHPMAYSPDTQLAYIPANRVPQGYGDLNPDDPSNSFWNIGYDLAAGLPSVYPKGTLEAIGKEISGSLLAWDPVAGKPAWEVPHITTGNGGILSTASGLVFQNTLMGEIVAYDARTGERLWSSPLNNPTSAPVMTYKVDGEQYLATATGVGGSWGVTYGFAWSEQAAPQPGKVITFKIGGTGELPASVLPSVARTPKGEAFGDDAIALLGMKRFADNCQFCHGGLAVSSGVLPDLRWSAYAGNDAAWDKIVREGLLTDRGMVSFADHLSKEETDAIRAYVLQQAWLAVANGDAQAPSIAAASAQ